MAALRRDVLLTNKLLINLILLNDMEADSTIMLNSGYSTITVEARVAKLAAKHLKPDDCVNDDHKEHEKSDV